MQAFYDTDYKISLQSDGHDQLYELTDDGPVFRTQHQARLVLDGDVPQGGRVLDFGSGKAATLQAIMAQRPDLSPHVFDVSRDYVEHWRGWISEKSQASYDLPASWDGTMDLVTAHFVLEHVADPVAVLRDMARMLKLGGEAFFLVPDPEANSGDLLVVDHINHFTRPALERLVSLSGLEVRSIESGGFRGAWTVRAVRSAPADLANASGAQAAASIGALTDLWAGILDAMTAAAPDLAGQRYAIYGAGFYGTLALSRMQEQPVCFIDSNPHLAGGTHLGIPVVMPGSQPSDLTQIVVALNPAIAKEAMKGAADWAADVPLRFFTAD
ncbi:class I SAM-dependent methyltransferase [Monaibacterium marinum]|uniref:class I SAM-dependent methyltransferase n=1 Tax=Pontivivens marinum TaxID=1690039 RepID=UPI0015E0E813|nr:class I SAM-dependent methyltransferase [Monaibacterium marinum]